MPTPQNIEFDSKSGIFRARFRGPFLGLDDTSALTDMDYLALPVAKNVDILENGTAKTRNGYTSLLTSAWGSRKIRGGIEFSYGGTNELCLFGEDGSTGTFGKVSGAYSSVTNISTSLAKQRPSLLTNDKLLFFFNGTDDFVYDGTATRQIGITPPSSAPTKNTDVAGSMLVGGVYIITYTYYNSTTGAESSPAPLFTAPAIAAGGGIKINVTAGSSTTADTIRVYTTLANQATLFLNTTALISATTVDLTQADAGISAGKQMELDNTRPSVWGKFKYGIASGNRVYLTGLSTNKNRVHISAIYTEGPRFESFPADKFVDCRSGGGIIDENVGLGTAGSTPIVIKSTSVGKIVKIGVDQNVSSDPSIFEYQEISRSVTAASHFAGCNLFGEYVWMGKDNIYATNGEEVRPLANKISNTIKQINFTNSDYFSAVNDILNKRILFSVQESSTSTEPDLVIVGHYHKYPEIYWTLYTKGTSPATHPGISAGCFIPVSRFSTPSLLFGNLGGSGKLYKMNYGYNDDGYGIYFKFVTAPVSFGLDEEEKLFVSDVIKAKSVGNSNNISIKSIYNLGSSTTEVEERSLSTATVQWNNSTWGGGFWNSTDIATIFHNSHRKAFYKQLELLETNIDTPVTIYSITMLARPTNIRSV